MASDRPDTAINPAPLLLASYDQYELTRLSVSGHVEARTIGASYYLRPRKARHFHFEPHLLRRYSCEAAVGHAKSVSVLTNRLIRASCSSLSVNRSPPVIHSKYFVRAGKPGWDSVQSRMIVQALKSAGPVCEFERAIPHIFLTSSFMISWVVT